MFISTALTSTGWQYFCVLCTEVATEYAKLGSRNFMSQKFLWGFFYKYTWIHDWLKNIKEEKIAKNCDQSLREIFHFVPKQIFSLKKILDEAVFYCIRDFLAPQRPAFYFMSFLSDAGRPGLPNVWPPGPFYAAPGPSSKNWAGRENYLLIVHFYVCIADFLFCASELTQF